MCSQYDNPDQHDAIPMLALIEATGDPADNRKAADLVANGEVMIARVVDAEYNILYEAYRVSTTSTVYAWKSSTMAVPAFAPMTPVYARRFAHNHTAIATNDSTLGDRIVADGR